MLGKIEDFCEIGDCFHIVALCLLARPASYQWLWRAWPQEDSLTVVLNCSIDLSATRAKGRAPEVCIHTAMIYLDRLSVILDRSGDIIASDSAAGTVH